MNILIFGSSGRTGKYLITEGLEKGHRITAFVRDIAGLTLQDNNLVGFQGNILNPNNIQEAMIGQNVVIIVLGNKTSKALFKKSTVISVGVANIISGMKSTNVKRLLFVSSFGLNEAIWLPEKLFIRIFLKNIFSEIPRQEGLVRQSGLAWTIVRPSRLVDSKRSGKYKIGDTLPTGLFSKISRADVADFLLKIVSDVNFVGKTVTISY
jgi:putative NADH-flavin reductase